MDLTVFGFILILASQLWLLGHLLPLMIGYLVPNDDEHWELFLQMMDIVDILFSPNSTEDHVSYVAVLINDHHKDFVGCTLITVSFLNSILWYTCLTCHFRGVYDSYCQHNLHKCTSN